MLGRDKTKKDTYMVKTLLNMFKRKQLNKNHPLQRKADQWTDEAKSGLVATVIKGEDIDSIKICEQILSSTEFILWLIDGLQRLTVLESYRNNAFKIGKTLEMPYVYYQKENEDGEMETIKYDLRGRYFDDLPEELQDAFDSYAIDVVKHLDCSDEEVAYHIGRYNRQTSMNTNQKNILPMYKVAGFIKKISDNNVFFEECGAYTEIEIRKGVVDRIVSESIMTMFHLDNWNKGKAMSKFLNENATQREFEIFESELDRLYKIIEKKTTGKLFNSKNSFVWFAAFHKFTKYGVDDLKFKDFLIAFQNGLHSKTFEEYDNYSFDTYENNKSTKDKKVVLAKLDILDKLMREYLHIEEVERDEIEEFSVLNFVKENVNPDTTEEDIEFYSDVLDDLTLEVDNNTRLLDEYNRPSLIALVGYACENECDDLLGEWIKNWFATNTMYIFNQLENYKLMLQSLQKGMVA